MPKKLLLIIVAGVMLYLIVLGLLPPPVIIDVEPNKLACEIVSNGQLHIMPCTLINEHLAKVAL